MLKKVKWKQKLRPPGLVLSSVPLGHCEERLRSRQGAETYSGAVAGKVGPLGGRLCCG